MTETSEKIEEEKGELAEDQLAPLQDWSNLPRVSDFRTNLDDAKQEHDVYITHLDRWRDNMHVTNTAKIKSKQGSSSVQPKLIRKQAEWRYAPLSEPFLSVPDLFSVNAKTAGDDNRAKQNKLVLNNQINTKLDKVTFFDNYSRAMVDTGTAVIKVGWRSESSEVTRTIPTYEYLPTNDPVHAERYAQLLQLWSTDHERYLDFSTPGLDKALRIFAQSGRVLIPKEIGTKTETKKEEIYNHPTWEIKNKRNVVVDPSCNGDIDKAGFVAEYFKTSKSALKKDGRYKNLDKINTEGVASPLANPDYVDGNEESNFEFKDKARKQFVATEYWGNWDIDNTGIAVPIVATWVGDVMIRLEKNPFPDQKPPYIVVPYMPMEDSVYGQPDAELLEDNQKIVGAVTRGMIDLLGKSANSQTGMRKDMLDVVNGRKFRKGEDYEYNAGIDPRQGTHTHTYPEIPQSAYNMITMQNNEAESMSGVKAFSSTGISGTGMGSTVGAARTALDAASKREIGILRRMASGIVKVGRKFISMNAEWLSKEEVVRVTAKHYVTVRRDDLAGNYDLELGISSAEEDDQKARELSFMLQTNGPNSDPAETRIIRAEIARLRKMPALAKMIEEYEPKPDPMAVKKAQLELVLLEKQGIKEEALAMKHAAEAEAAGLRGYKDKTQGDLNSVKMGTESAKAGEHHSKAEKTKLDTIEQSTGTTQAREKEKMNLKATNDLVSKAVDSINAEPVVPNS